MTPQPQPAYSTSQNENGAESVGTPRPLDRNSEEWRSQFGVLPSAYQQGAAARPAPTRGGRADSSRRSSESSRKSGFFSFLVAVVGMVVVGGLIAYGYGPSQQAGKPKTEPKVSHAVAVSGTTVKRLQGKTAVAPSAAPVKMTAKVSQVPVQRTVQMPGLKRPAVPARPKRQASAPQSKTLALKPISKQ
ncbi:MAG: hypothetical protein V4671_03555 [Armatimonadota bacterium]